MRVIVPQPVFQQLQNRLARPCRLPPIPPLYTAPSGPRRISTRNPALRLANPPQHLRTDRICNHISCHSSPSSPTSRGTSPLASPADPSPQSPHPASPATPQSTRPSSPAETRPSAPAAAPHEISAHSGRSSPSPSSPRPQHRKIQQL